jgi:hypothetical protein
MKTKRTDRELLNRRVVILESRTVAERLERAAIERGHSLGAEVREAVRDHLRRLEGEGGRPA